MMDSALLRAVPYAVCRMPYAVCRMPYAVCRMPSGPQDRWRPKGASSGGRKPADSSHRNAPGSAVALPPLPLLFGSRRPYSHPSGSMPSSFSLNRRARMALPPPSS